MTPLLISSLSLFFSIKFEDISKVSYHQNRFSVHFYAPSEEASEEDDIVSIKKFHLTSRKSAQALFRAFTESHTFFRVCLFCFLYDTLYYVHFLFPGTPSQTFTIVILPTYNVYILWGQTSHTPLGFEHKLSTNLVTAILCSGVLRSCQTRSRLYAHTPGSLAQYCYQNVCTPCV